MNLPDFGCLRARSRTIPVDGVALHALEWGEPGRPPLCFLHGGAAHAHWFDLAAPAFADRFHVVALDQRGHGASAWAHPPSYATEDFVSDLVAVFDAFGWREVTLVGHSMGGANSIACAAWHPERVRALVVVDSRPAIPAERLDAMRDRGARPMRRHPSVDAAVAAFRLLPRETVADPALLAHLARAGIVERDGGWVFRFDPATYGVRRPVDGWTLAGRITAPTLVVRGEHSPILPKAMAARLEATIPKAKAIEIAGAHHHLVLDRPKEFVTVLDEFLSGL
ncbi:MAG: alpha/beta hydrolase [Candidatus Rokubacteria bacterium]|nr:alpha/beta hydrolase [Candidatus Rokubacteria bacterium]